MARLLRPEIASLIHHVELNKAGWWGRALQRLVLAILWSDQAPQSIQHIGRGIKDQFGVNVEDSELKSAIAILIEEESVASLTNGLVHLTVSARERLESQKQQSDQLSTEAKGAFEHSIELLCPDLDSDRCWDAFNNLFLLPLVRELGAHTYNLMVGETQEHLKPSHLKEFLAQFAADRHDKLKGAVLHFLDPTNSATRGYTLSLLTAHLLVEAASPSASTLKVLRESMAQRPSFTAFIDTNFLFSILGLHDNPSNEAAVTLNRLVSAIESDVTVALSAADITVQETRIVLTSLLQQFRSIRITPGIAKAAAQSELSGLGRRFMDAAASSKVPITSDTYFGPYVSDLVKIMASRGVALYGESAASYKDREKVYEDIDNQLWYQESFGRKQKGYDQIAHDVSLWHFVHDKRPPSVESPIVAGYWVLTVDYRFLAYDSWKRDKLKEAVPVCLHPSSFVQVLQFWVPRSTVLDQAILSSIRLPLLFEPFDASAERIVVRILSALGRFENVDDIPEHVVAEIAMNTALRQRMPMVPNADVDQQLVREALIDTTRRAIEAEKEVRLDAKRLADELEDRKTGHLKLQSRLLKSEEERKTLERNMITLQKEAEDAKTLATKLQGEGIVLEGKVSLLTAIVRLIAGAIVGAIVLFAILTGAFYLSKNSGWFTATQSYINLSLLGVAGLAGICILAVGREPLLRDRTWGKWLISGSKFALSTVVLGFIVNVIAAIYYGG